MEPISWENKLVTDSITILFNAYIVAIVVSRQKLRNFVGVFIASLSLSSILSSVIYLMRENSDKVRTKNMKI